MKLDGSDVKSGWKDYVSGIIFPTEEEMIQYQRDHRDRLKSISDAYEKLEQKFEQYKSNIGA